MATLWAMSNTCKPNEGRRRTTTYCCAGDDLVSVFVPMTPNPTTGFLRFVPRDEIVPLDMSLEDATKLIISAGLVTEPTPLRPAAASRNRRARWRRPRPSR